MLPTWICLFQGLLLPTLGSTASLQGFLKRFGDGVLSILAYYDAAVAARHIRVPVHCAWALFDPVVAPPCQFAVYNALPGPKDLFVLDAGHAEYPRKELQEQELKRSLLSFFANL